MVINPQKHSRYISLTIGLIAVLYIIRLILLVKQSGSSRPLDIFTAGIYLEISFLTILAVIISKTRQVIENVNETEFAIAIRVGNIALMMKTFRKQDISKIEIQQDSKRYYCLKIQLQDHSPLLISRYPNLLPVEQELSVVKMELGI